MSEPVRAVVLAHGPLAEGLIGAVKTITGRTDRLVALSNAGCGRKVLLERLEAAAGSGPVVVFTDLPGGSCAQCAAVLRRRRDGVSVVSGVNLAMLLDFVTHEERSAAEAAARAVDAGRSAVAGMG